MSGQSLQCEKSAILSRGRLLIFGAILAIALACIAALATPGNAYAYGFKSISSTSSSITLTWDDPCASISTRTTLGYVVAWADSTETDSSKIKTKELTASDKSLTITGLKAGTKYAIVNACVYLDSSGNAQQSFFASENGVGTRVVKPTGIKQTKWSYKNNTAYFSWNMQTAADQVQCRLVNAATGKKIIDRTWSALPEQFYVYGMSKNVTYAVQMRVHDSKGWTAWSTKLYFIAQPLTTKATKVSGNKLTVAWGKVAGAQKYNVYVSTKSKSGYKKLATVKSTKTKTVLKRLGGKKFSAKKTYYVYVEAVKKIGSKTYTSGKHYAYKVKGKSGSIKYPF